MGPVPVTSEEGPWALRVDHGSGIPLWVQLKTQLEHVITAGVVPAGTRLPSVRALSSELGVAIDTIRQAYEELGKTGLVVTQRGTGTFTTAAGGQLDAPVPDPLTIHAGRSLVIAELQQSGLSWADLSDHERSLVELGITAGITVSRPRADD